MKLCVLGKIGGITRWTEDCVAGFRSGGHEVRLGVTRNPKLHPMIEKGLSARWAGMPRAAMIARMIRRFQPDLIVAVVPHGIPLAILHHVAAMPGRAPLVGWVGDAFTASDRGRAELFDALAYTDTGLMASHRAFGFRPTAVFVPHAASPRLSTDRSNLQRINGMVFVAHPTPHRRAVLQAVAAPVWLYGPGWSALAAAGHHVADRRVGARELASLYQRHLAVLNIRHETNTLTGLNQRHFDPYVSATPVLADDQHDIPLCFEPGREILIYQASNDLNETYARLRQDTGHAAAIGAAGQRRVLAHHTYAKRLEALAEPVR